MHKIVLYNPRAVFYTMPLALIAVGSALDRQKYEVVIVDGRIHSQDELYQQLEGALCLGITVLTGAPLQDALHVSRAVHARYPDLPIIWGGWHPSLFPQMCAAEPSVAAIVTGQGEETFADIVTRLAAGDSITAAPGMAVHSPSGEATLNLPRPMSDINRLPRHDYSLIDVERYFQLKGQRQLDYISSQGCRFRCNFCADPAVYKRGWFGLRPERMLEEINELWRRHRFADLSFQDETYFTHPHRVAEVAEGFLEAGLDFSWFGTMRADQGRRLDDEVYALCKRSGLRRVMIGLEAGTQETIDLIQKDITVEDMWITAEKLMRHRIGAMINVIVGFPDEPPESVRETLRVAQQLRAMSSDFELAIFYFKPYPGNPIAERLQAQGFELPNTLEAWAEFDYIGSSNDWLTEAQKREIEHFKFYQRYAYSGNRNPIGWPLKKISRWRLTSRNMTLPVERKLMEWIRPQQTVS